ncbi:MAG: hypothetical protein LBD37_04705 [Treponema sp.]|jgi:hypothetical protein|nr:hypothetical protein [Treponema sp.]
MTRKIRWASAPLFCAALLFFACENPESGAETAQPAGNESENGNGDGNGPGQNPSGGVPIKRLTVSPQNTSVVKGDSLRFTAAVEGAGEEKPDQSVVWSVIGEHDPQTAIDGAGLFTAAPGEAALTLTIRAAAKADAGKYGSATVSLIDAPSVAQVTVEPQDARVAQGFECQFAAMVEAAGNADKTVVWSLSGNTRAGTLISASGLLTVAGTEPADTELVITATSAADGTKSGSAVVRVTENIPLPNLEHTAWRWGDRPQGSITIKEFVVESVDAAGVQHGHLNCYRPFDPEQQVYVDWYSYNPAAKTGEIEYIGKFRVTPENGKIIVPQYASYPHGAEFTRLYEETQGPEQ